MMFLLIMTGFLLRKFGFITDAGKKALQIYCYTQFFHVTLSRLLQQSWERIIGMTSQFFLQLQSLYRLWHCSSVDSCIIG